MSNSSAPKAEYNKEVRFAVVMYGGVSLAIYINGVAQELFRMVRSTAENVNRDDGTRVPLSGALTADAEIKLKGTERVYRKVSHLLADERLLDECRKLVGDSTPTGSYGALLMQKLDALIADAKQPVGTKFVVDILSGTSAGGINAIYLAKAFANDQQIDQLKDLWVNEGDIALLLNDKRSVAGLHLRNQVPPQSLLNSRRMYFKLLKSLEDMEDQRPSSKGFNSPYVDEMDLFITTTDIEGVPLPLRLADAVVFERRHRSVFHFRYGKAEVVGADFNDFLRKSNPFLAFAARCTSSFPFAFEPMRLGDIKEVLDLFGQYKSFDQPEAEKQWKRYFQEELDPKTGSPIEPPRFSRRAFGDGGYLDNKPFSYATETLAHRTSDVPVDRKLIYIEPSPEHPEDEPATFEKINALQNVKAAIVDLPTYETIREDLQRVLERNQLIERVNRIVSSIERDVNQYIPLGIQDLLRRRQLQQATEEGPRYSMRALGTGSGGPPSMSDTDSDSAPSTAMQSPHDPPSWASMDLVDMVNKNSRYFLPYRRLRIASVTDLIARLFARLANFDEKSDQFLAIRALVRIWRDETFVEYVEEGLEELETVNRFLWSFDFGYRQRRLSFVRAKVDQLSGFGQKLIQELEDLTQGLQKLTDDSEAVQLTEEVLQEFPQIRLQQYGERLLAFKDRPELLQPVTRFIKSELNEISKQLRTWGRWLRARQGRPQTNSPKHEDGSEPNEELPSPLLKHIETLGVTPEDLTFILGMTGESTQSNGQDLDEDDLLARAQSLLDRTDKGHIRTNLGTTAAELASNLELAFHQVRKATNELFSPLAAYRPISERGKQLLADEPALLNSEIAEIARGFLSYYYNQFDDYDQIRFPIMYETDYGEADVVEVIRISPEDATSLINERQEFFRSPEPAKARKKLAGVSLHHFGAFLDRTWRQNDIMWGRLDGAERLISGLLPGNLNEKIRRELIKEAHLAILKEELKPESLLNFQGIITDALLRASSGLSINEAIDQTLQPLKGSPVKTRLEAIMRLSLADEELLSYMSKAYEVNRQLDPKTMLSSISRSTQIIGKMFEDLADANGLEGKRLAWIARFGQVFWGLIEVAVPNSILNLMLQHWLKLLYVFEVLLIAGSILFNTKEVQNFGWKALGVTLAINIIVLLLSDYMRLRRRWRNVILLVFAASVVTLAVFGVLDLYALGYKGILTRVSDFGQNLWARVFG